MDKFSKNEEILEKFSDLSQPVVYAIADASNPEYKIVYLVQQDYRQDNSIKPTKVQEILLGWKPGFNLLRTAQTVREDIFNNLKIESGYIFKDFNIVSSVALEQAFDGQTPVVDSNGKIKLVNGYLVYEHTELVYGEVEKEQSKKEEKLKKVVEKRIEKIEEEIKPKTEQKVIEEDKEEGSIENIEENYTTVQSEYEQHVDTLIIPKISMDESLKEKTSILQDMLSEEEVKEEPIIKKSFSLLD